MKLLDNHPKIDPVQYYSFKCYLQEFYNDYKNLNIAHDAQKRMQNILGNFGVNPDTKPGSQIFVPPFHLLKPVQVSDDLRHIVDTPVNALKLISKMETKPDMNSKKERLDNLQSFMIDDSSTLPKGELPVDATPNWHKWSKIQEILNGFGEPLSDNDKTLLLYSILKGFCLDVYICIGQDAKTGERKTWVVEARKHLTIENQIEFPAADIEDANELLKDVFKVEKEKTKIERNFQSPQKRIVKPTDSVFSENFRCSVLMRPTMINWAHQFEKPIAD